jgi:hypothetical protein
MNARDDTLRRYQLESSPDNWQMCSISLQLFGRILQEECGEIIVLAMRVLAMRVLAMRRALLVALCRVARTAVSECIKVGQASVVANLGWRAAAACGCDEVLTRTATSDLMAEHPGNGLRSAAHRCRILARRDTSPCGEVSAGAASLRAFNSCPSRAFRPQRRHGRIRYLPRSIRSTAGCRRTLMA